MIFGISIMILGSSIMILGISIMILGSSIMIFAGFVGVGPCSANTAERLPLWGNR